MSAGPARRLELPGLGAAPVALALCLLAAPGALAGSISFEGGPVVLGRVESVPVTLEVAEVAGDDDRPLRLAVNVGSFGEITRVGPGRYRTVYVPPPTRFPQVALVAIWREVGPDSDIEFLRLPLVGITRVPVKAAPGSEVRVRIGPQTFGPVATDARGQAVVPAEVPPGVRRAVLVVKEASGPETTRQIPIEVPPYNRLTAALVPHAIAADGKDFARVVVFYDLGGAAIPAAGFGFFADATCATPVAGLTFPIGSSQRFFFRGQAAGTVSIAATAQGLAAAQQLATVAPGPTVALVWDPISSPRTVGTPIEVRIRAFDQYGNATPAFDETVDLASASSGTVNCVGRCAASTSTGAFHAGSWTGELVVTAPPSIQSLTAARGALSGASASIELVASNAIAAPSARFDLTPALELAGRPVTFDASASTDLNAAPAELEVSWDFDGSASGGPPWTPWSRAKKTFHTYSAPGGYQPRLAVRGPSGLIGYAARTLTVLQDAGGFCQIDTASEIDDGASSCAGQRGTDGKLSLPEAVRLANATAGKQTLTFTGSMAISSGTPLAISDSLDLLAPPGVLLDLPIAVSAGDVVLSNLELSSRALQPLRVETGAALFLADARLRGTSGVTVLGSLTAERSGFLRCSGSCIEVAHASASAVVRHTDFRDGAAAGVSVSACRSSPSVDVWASTFLRMKVGVSSACQGPMLVRNNTFHANQIGVRYFGGADQVLRNNLFSASTFEAVRCGAASFASRDFHGLFQNASNGCLAADPGSLASDPLYVAPDVGDFRVQPASPARDTAADLGLDLDGPGPGAFLGAGPDRGGKESG